MQPTDSPLRHYLQVVKRRAWLVVLVPVLTLAVAFALLAIPDTEFRAERTLVVGQPNGPKLPPELGSGSVTRTLTNLLESDPIARTVIRDLRLDTSIEGFGKKLTVEVLPDTSVLEVSYTDTSRRRALAVVNALVRTFTREVDEALGVQAGQPRQRSFNLVVREFADPQVEPIPRKRVTKLAFAAVVGLALGIILAVAREAVDLRMRGRKEAETWFGAPVVGSLPRGMRGKPPPGTGAAAFGRRDHRAVASLDLLRARLEFAQMGISGPNIAVTSAVPHEGKSTVAANLGAALARAGKHVVCVDADIRRPSLHRLLGVEHAAPGLVDVLEAGVDIDQALVPVDLMQPTLNGGSPAESYGRLDLLPAGSSPSSPIGLLTPEAVAFVMERLRERADYVIFDSPPLLAADSFPLAVQSDNVIVVARRGSTTRDHAETVRATLEGLGVGKVGVVLTDAAVGDGYY